jgi:hypothetical protein
VILTKWNSGLQPLQSHIKHSATKDRGPIKPASSSSLGIELTSSLRIGEFPCRLLRTKNHHFAALRFPDFQRLLAWCLHANNSGNFFTGFIGGI